MMTIKQIYNDISLELKTRYQLWIKYISTSQTTYKINSPQKIIPCGNLYMANNV